MPIYDYTCATCGPFSALRSLSATDDAGSCPSCSSPSPKTLSAPAYLGGSKRQRAYDAVASNPLRKVPEARATLQATEHRANCPCCER